jgi:hypothetical protein
MEAFKADLGQKLRSMRGVKKLENKHLFINGLVSIDG